MIVSLSVAACCGTALAQGVPDYDFQWTTVGNLGNAPYTSANPDDANVNGRGSVNHEFRASRLEITTAQWMEFVNAFAPFDNSPIDQNGPLIWGAQRAQRLPNGHWIMGLGSNPITAQLPIGGISWRDAARYCNWLTNNKQVSLAAISTGSYDTTTWGNRDSTTGAYPDDPHRMPGAKFFLPEISEYLKATHYDPNRYGEGQGGYWQYKTGLDTPPIPGLPGEGNTNAGYLPGGDPFAAWNIPLGSYSSVQTAYGLFDTSGGGKEWIEGWNEQVTVNGRMYLGSYSAMSPSAIPTFDSIGAVSGSDDLVNPQNFTSFRVYSVVPSPGVSAWLIAGTWTCRRKRSSRK
jgi:formylglycine-generating enzyme required for sulfatase activity